MKRKEFFELWIKALESGEYKQKQGTLVEVDEDEKVLGYCCLGVACDLASKNGVSVNFVGKSYLPIRMQKFLGIEEEGYFNEPIKHRGRSYDSLAKMNDAGVKFKTIARVIREQLERGNFRKS